MKTYYLKRPDLVTDTRLTKKSRLLKLIYDKYIGELESALENDDVRRVINIVDNFNTELYKESGVWFDTFDYYEEYVDNLNGYISLMINHLNKVFD